MFVHDYYFNYFQVGAESLGEKFFQGDKLAFGPAFQTAWEPLAQGRAFMEASGSRAVTPRNRFAPVTAL